MYALNSDIGVDCAKEMYRPYLNPSSTTLNNYHPLNTIMELINSFCIDMDEHDFKSPSLSGALLPFDEFNLYSIVININHPTPRRIFTLAHELGHYIMHRKVQSEFLCNDLFRKENEPLEIQANNFAAELILPDFIFRQIFYKKMRINEISHKFSISPDCIRWRTMNFYKANSNRFDQNAHDAMYYHLFVQQANMLIG